MAAGKIDLGNGTAPATPAAGFSSLYFDASKRLCFKDDSGKESAVSPLIATVSTTDDTPTQVAGSDFVPTDDAVVMVRARVLGIRDSLDEAAGYELVATFRVASGVVTLIGMTSIVDHADDYDIWGAEIVTDGTEISVEVTGASGANINWSVALEVSSLVATP